MTRARAASRNMIWILIARGVDILSNLLIVASVARYLGVDSFGVYSVIIAAIFTLMPLFFMDLPRILARDIAQDRSKAEGLVGKALMMIIVMAGTAVTLGGIYALLVKPSGSAILIGIIVLSCMTVMAMTRTINALYLVFEKMHFEALNSLLLSVSSNIFTWLAVYFDLGFASLLAALLLANLVCLVMSLSVSVRNLSITPRVGMLTRNQLSYFVGQSAPTIASQSLVMALLYSSLYALSILGTSHDAGIFQAPYRIIMRLQMAPMAAIASVFPLLSQLAITDMPAYKATALTLVKFVFIATLPLMLVGFFYADGIVRVIFGPAFSDSATALRLQVGGVAFLALNTTFESLFMTRQRQKYYLYATAFGLFVSIACNLLLVPSYGYMGASAVTIISQAAITGLSLYFLSEVIAAREIIAVLSRSAFVALGTFAILIFSYWMNGIVIGMVGLAAFVVMLFAFKTFSPKELQFLKKTIARKASAA
jgi:O-antigen/teichoic acid export membrane protein